LYGILPPLTFLTGRQYRITWQWITLISRVGTDKIAASPSLHFTGKCSERTLTIKRSTVGYHNPKSRVIHLRSQVKTSMRESIHSALGVDGVPEIDSKDAYSSNLFAEDWLLSHYMASKTKLLVINKSSTLDGNTNNPSTSLSGLQKQASQSMETTYELELCQLIFCRSDNSLDGSQLSQKALDMRKDLLTPSPFQAPRVLIRTAKSLIMAIPQAVIFEFHMKP